MTNPFVFVDFNNIAENGQLRLDCIGTRDDLQRRGIQLEDGLVLDVADGDLYAKIVVRSAGESGPWRGEMIEGPNERRSDDEP